MGWQSAQDTLVTLSSPSRCSTLVLSRLYYPLCAVSASTAPRSSWMRYPWVRLLCRMFVCTCFFAYLAIVKGVLILKLKHIEHRSWCLLYSQFLTIILTMNELSLCLYCIKLCSWFALVHRRHVYLTKTSKHGIHTKKHVNNNLFARTGNLF